MSYLDKLKKAGVVSNLIETAEYGAASFAFGYVQNRYREKASVMGVPVDLAAGVGMKVLALAGDLLGKGGGLTPHVNVVGNAGVASFFHTLGAQYGARNAGVARILVKAQDVEKAKAALSGKGMDVLGAISPAPQGDFLSARQLADMAR